MGQVSDPRGRINRPTGPRRQVGQTFSGPVGPALGARFLNSAGGGVDISGTLPSIPIQSEGLYTNRHRLDGFPILLYLDTKRLFRSRV